MVRTRGRPANRRNNNDNTGNIDPALLAPVNQAVENAIAQSVPQAIANTLQNNRPEHNNELLEKNDQPENNHPENNAPAAHVLLKKFQKQKPESFRDAPKPLDAENWIAHLEKLFDVLETTNNQNVRFATYKLEGDARRWWTTLNGTQGDGYVEALAWRDFPDIFYEQYFPISERDVYRREYLNIRQNANESITAYMVHFIRVAGIAGAMVGSAADQAEHFKWGLPFEYRRALINTKLPTVAHVGNATRNLELERADYNSHRSDGSRKRGRDEQSSLNNDHRAKFQLGNQRDFGNRPQGNQSWGWQGQGSYHNKGNNNGQL
ncbi:hypothetical protein E3N88_38574 [Mikania micrantha]|uniref:Retrotransposon gag domain-containing protein n=1 Tax=Mikania micrantha TaxID=192012 RepID=A0A5N6LUF6_9ASTR|nr:hypothetical protein E3N88_38574 [Mikania micrantha]